MTIKNQQQLEFYAVYYARYDGAAPPEDLFYELRRDFLQNRQRLKNKVVRRFGGIDYRYSYLLETGSPMKWKKLAGYRLLEKSFAENDGSYQIVTQDSQKQTVKASFFDFDHRWKRTEYFSPDVKKIPTAILMPVRDGAAITVKEYAPRQGEENGYELFPCEIPEDREEASLLNGAAGIPEIIARTNQGDFYFCRLQEVERRKKVLEAIRSGNQAKPLFTPERRPEDADPQTDRESGFRVEQSVDAAPEATLPISQELLLSENIGDRVEQLKTEVEAALSRYEQTDSYQWGTGSPDLEKYCSPEQGEEDREALSARNVESPAFKELDPPQGRGEAPEPLDQTFDAPADTQEELGYECDRMEPLTAGALQQSLSGLTSDERQKYRRYNVIIKHMDRENDQGADAAVEGPNLPAAQDTDPTAVGGEPAFDASAVCNGVENGCPYVNQGKMRIDVSPDESYYYFGNVVDGLREGRGRTLMQNGCTAFEGNYVGDKREGFGVYYYKTGRLCYAGSWKANKRHGTGVSFRPHDGTIHVGRWEEDVPVGMGSRFDQDGNLLFAGRWENGKRQGAGVTYHAQDGRIFVGQWKDDVLTGKGTEFDGQGNLMYTGGWKDCKRNGFGAQYRQSGEVIYSGHWKDNRYEGEGTIHLEDGSAIQGEFRDGQVCGHATEYDAYGAKVYEGAWKDGRYHGDGCKFFPNGGRYEGMFHNGEPQGYLKGYDAKGRLVYNGEWRDDRFEGQGSYYVQGEKVYEGGFHSNCYNGHGYQYQDGSYVFSGNFVNNERNGYGCSYQHGKLRYAGLWKADLFDGAGVLYEDGQPRYAGAFRKGELHGRCNTIRDGKVCEEGVYEDGTLLYVKRYDPETGSLLFEGNILDGKPNGMGCFFTPFGEKREEGIFVDGILRKSMKVSLRNLSPLPEKEDLVNTEYEKYSSAPVYAVEQSIGNGMYSGQLHNGVPHGKGTMLYQDHRYTGCFQDGKPFGKGIVYRDDGTTLVGEFYSDRTQDCEHLQFENGICYDYQPMEEPK